MDSLHQRLAAQWLADADIGEKGHDTSRTPFGLASVRDGVEPLLSQSVAPEHAARVRALARRASWPPLLACAYQLLNDDKTEFTLHGWTFMSLHSVQTRLQQYAQNGQTRLCDVAIRYEGMGHCRVLCVDTATGRWMQRMDGGSNGYEQDHNWNFACALDPAAADAQAHAWDPLLPVHPQPLVAPW